MHTSDCFSLDSLERFLPLKVGGFSRCAADIFFLLISSLIGIPLFHANLALRVAGECFWAFVFRVSFVVEYVCSYSRSSAPLPRLLLSGVFHLSWTTEPYHIKNF